MYSSNRKTDETGKILPCSIVRLGWGGGRELRIWYLSLSSQWHRQGKVSVKVSGCRIGKWLATERIYGGSQLVGRQNKVKRKGGRVGSG